MDPKESAIVPIGAHERFVTTFDVNRCINNNDLSLQSIIDLFSKLLTVSQCRKILSLGIKHYLNDDLNKNNQNDEINSESFEKIENFKNELMKIIPKQSKYVLKNLCLCFWRYGSTKNRCIDFWPF